MKLRASMAILVFCPSIGCSAAGTGDEPLQVVDDRGAEGPAVSPEAPGAAPASARSPQGGLAEPAARSDDGSCAALATRLAPRSEPLDFILVLDNSASMEDELRAAELSLDGSLGTLLAESDIDYRIVLLSQHRSRQTQDTAVCIQGPLTTLTSCPSPLPGESARFFQYSTEVEGEDVLDVLLESFSGAREDDFGLANLGWSEWLRPGARKIFLVLTEDDADLPAMEFAAALTELAPEQFGPDPSQFNFTWHSIVGMAAAPGAAAAQAAAPSPYLPDAPIQEQECEGNVSNPGETYQELSRLTGGLRFPICDMGAYGLMFQQIVEASARTQASCDFALPAAPLGRSLELGEAALSYQGLAAAPTVLGRTEQVSSCQADGFFLDGDVVHLCPQACSTALAAAGGELQLRFQCRSSPP